MSLISVADAQARMIAKGQLMATENLPLELCAGRVTSEDVLAKITQPPFDASAMDGYAVRSVDCTSLPQSFKLIGESSAGHPFSGELSAGNAVRIFTGAVVPSGADAIAIQEDCDRPDDENVVVKEVSPPGKFIRVAGYDFHEGDELVTKGTTLGYRHLALLASMNVASVEVYKKPKVAIIATGDELVSPGEVLSTGQIISSIPFGMKHLLEKAGAEAHCLGIAKDDLQSLSDILSTAKDPQNEFDIIVTIGGASVGDHDLVQEALKLAGMELDFWRIAMRPGKPLMVGSLNNQSIVGVPGNPVSALICSEIFVVPLIRSMLGHSSPIKVTSQAVLQNEVSSNGPRKHYMRSFFWVDDKGQQRVKCVENQDSSLQATFAFSNCLIVRAPHSDTANQGELVDIYPLD
ncbi:molybdopterin molybdotransferase MoeA [Hyphomicrobiales bacterium 4NK60-0047b]